jgi:plastocyanin
VSFANSDDSKHSIIFSSVGDADLRLPTPTGNILKEKSAETTFTVAGTFEYTSESNPNMRGTIVVA